MKSFAILVVGLSSLVVLLSAHSSWAQAQPVASITLPTPGGTVQLYPLCNNLSLTFENGTPSETVVQAVTPSETVQAMWRHNAALNKFEGFSPAAPQASDLLTVNFLDAVWLCVARSGGELTLEEYFAQIEAISRGSAERSEALWGEFEDGLGEAVTEEQQIAALRDFFNAALTIFQEHLADLDDIEPPTGVEAAHDEYVAALEELLRVSERLANRLGEIESIAEAEQLSFDDPELDAAGDRVARACVGLQAIADDNGIEVDLDCDEELAAESAAALDGTWRGTTSQEETFEFTVKDRGITSVLVAFESPGCELDSPISISYPEPRHFIPGNMLSLSEEGTHALNITGTFSDDATVSGTLEIPLGPACEGNLDLIWYAVRGDGTLADLLSLDPAALIPEVEIQDDLFLREEAATNFDKNTGILYLKGDWFLVVTSVRSILPIPSGWTTIATGGETYLLFSEDGDLRRPTIRVRLSSEGFEGDTRTSEEVLAEFEEEASEATPSFAVLKKEIVDADKGYIFAKVETESEKIRYVLELVSKSQQWGWFYVFSAFTYEEDWDDYYPIIRGIVEGWAGLFEDPLGVALPDTFPE